jgi:cytochrome c oxidase assembly factor CtaG
VLLGIVVPLLVVLAAPLRLALQAGAAGTRQLLRTALHSPGGRLCAHPLVGWGLFGGGLVAIYLTPLLDLAARHDLVHLAVHAHVVGSGVLFLVPLVGVDTLPRRLPHPARLLALLAAIPFHAFVALAMLTASSPLAPDAYPSLDDQRQAAALFWGAGEIFTVAAAAVVMRQWWVAEQRAAARESRRLDDPAPAV